MIDVLHIGPNIKPTNGHYFIRLLYEKGILVRNYTQNIDGLEKKAGIPSKKVVQVNIDMILIFYFFEYYQN